jgi:hypothetical protein
MSAPPGRPCGRPGGDRLFFRHFRHFRAPHFSIFIRTLQGFYFIFGHIFGHTRCGFSFSGTTHFFIFIRNLQVFYFYFRAPHSSRVSGSRVLTNLGFLRYSHNFHFRAPYLSPGRQGRKLQNSPFWASLFSGTIFGHTTFLWVFFGHHIFCAQAAHRGGVLAGGLCFRAPRFLWSGSASGGSLGGLCRRFDCPCLTVWLYDCLTV